MSNQSELALLLKRNNELLTVLAKAQLSSIIENELSDDKKKKLYKLTGKSLTGKQVSTKLGMSTGAISGIWQHWESQGILIKEGQKYRRIFDD